MVSEYANGPHRWLLTSLFFGWALSSFALAMALLPLSATTLGKAGLVFLLLAGIGQMMGGLFDINHKLHGPAMIGIPSLCLAAILVTMAMARRSALVAPPYWSAHLPWIMFIAMIGALVLFMASLKAAGVDVTAQQGPLKELPPGGNRLCRMGQPSAVCRELSVGGACVPRRDPRPTVTSPRGMPEEWEAGCRPRN